MIRIIQEAMIWRRASRQRKEEVQRLYEEKMFGWSIVSKRKLILDKFREIKRGGTDCVGTN